MRFTYHFEATYDVRRTMELARQTGKEVCVALNPETPISSIRDIADELDMVLLMAVTPGAQGQEFDAKIIDKVSDLRAAHPKLAIGVDGGVNPLVAPNLIAAGANMLVSGSFIFESDDIAHAIKELQGG